MLSLIILIIATTVATKYTGNPKQKFTFKANLDINSNHNEMHDMVTLS